MCRLLEDILRCFQGKENECLIFKYKRSSRFAILFIVQFITDPLKLKLKKYIFVFKYMCWCIFLRPLSWCKKKIDFKKSDFVK